MFIADTDYGKAPRPGDTGGTYDKGYDGPDWTFVPDRPGPYDIPLAPHVVAHSSVRQYKLAPVLVRGAFETVYSG